jgi:TonB family protein
MSETMPLSRIHDGAEYRSDDVLGVLMGLSFTFVLFLAIASFEDTSSVEPVAEIEDLRPMSIPMDAPPAKPVERPQEIASPVPLMGIEVAAADSPVKITVVAPDITELMPDVEIAPSAVIQTEQLYTNFKPQIDSGLGDNQRVYRQSEVDERPKVLSRPNPNVPKVVRGRATMLRISLLIVVDTKGSVESIRVLDSSGNEGFDEIIIGDVKKLWVFTPAAKKGRKVKCMLQQTVRVTWEAGSPFER